MKTACRIGLIGALAAVAFAAAAADKKLTVAINFPQSDSTFAALTAIAQDYMKQNPGVSIDVVTLPQYEHAMKTKMAANDLPDLFSTHGWSVARYSEYLTPLNDQPWFSKINPTIKPVSPTRPARSSCFPSTWTWPGQPSTARYWTRLGSTRSGSRPGTTSRLPAPR